MTSKTRVVGYSFEGQILDGRRVQRLLGRAVKRGVVTEWDMTIAMDPKCSKVWFNGPPGDALRVVREAVRALVQSDCIASKAVVR